MEVNLPYLLRVAIALTVFYLAYHLLFKKEKMFLFNRLYLILSMLLSFFIPLITFHEQIVLPEVMVAVQPAQIIVTQPSSPDFNWQLATELLFLSGFLFFLTVLISGHLKVWRIVKKSSKKHMDGYLICTTQRDIPPFTYFGKLIIPSSILNKPHLHTVICHEQIHAKGQHCLDICIAEFLFLFQWFNPFAWLMKNAVKDNLEFLTDAEAISQIDKQEYQLSMVSLASKTTIFAFPSISNQSQLKKRIIMMKRNKPNRFQWIKSLALLPILTILTVTLSGREIQIISSVPAVEEISIIENKEVSGRIVDENGDPLSGVIVLVKGSTTGTVTNANGNFKLANIADDAILSIVMVGYAKMEVNVGQHSNIILSKETNIEVDNDTKVAKSNVVNDKKISGTVADEVQKPIIGVAVTVKGGTTGAITDANGNFELANIANDAILIFSMPTYEKTEVPAGKQNLNVILKKDTAKSEVVISAQGTKRTEDARSINEMKAEEVKYVFEIKRTGDVVHPINEMDTVISAHGVKITQPLFIVDGIEYSSKTLELTPDQIESMEIVKGEKANDVYGEKAKNGVIIITTKSKVNKYTNVVFNVKSSTENNPLYIVDGEKKSKASFDQINAGDIESILVLKEGETLEVYGEEAKDGVVIITTKNNLSKPKSTSINIKSSTGNKPLFIVDGEKKSKTSFDQINAGDIESMEILKGEKAIKLYGEEAKNGVVIITTKNKSNK